MRNYITSFNQRDEARREKESDRGQSAEQAINQAGFQRLTESALSSCSLHNATTEDLTGNDNDGCAADITQILTSTILHVE